MKYRVIWEIDLDAESPREAAELALKIHRDPDSIATVFVVKAEGKNVFEIEPEKGAGYA